MNEEYWRDVRAATRDQEECQDSQEKQLSYFMTKYLHSLFENGRVQRNLARILLYPFSNYIEKCGAEPPTTNRKEHDSRGHGIAIDE